MDNLSEEKRTPRKRAVRQRATRERTPREAEVSPVERARPEVPPVAKARVADAVERKAPTPFAASKVVRHRKQKQMATVVGGLLFAVGVSAVVGLTDSGQIDVQKTIEARNDRIRSNTASEADVVVSTVEIPVQNTNARKADGGLIGRGTGGAAPLPVPAAKPPVATGSTTEAMITATTTASTTDVTPAADEAVVEPVADEAAPAS